MRILPIFLIFISFNAQAKKFALVVGGATNANVGAGSTVPKIINDHEFGKSTARAAFGLERQGYEVTTLFDTVGTPQERMPPGLKVLQDSSVDMPKLREMGAQSANKDNILNALRRIRDTAKAGDEFEFNLNAHGFRSCEDDLQGRNGVSVRPEDRQNKKSGCQHTVNLSDPVTGTTVQVPTEEFAKIIREIDAKGIKTNVNLLSCHSGAAQEAFSNLRNTCVMYGSSANNYAFMCMPSDKGTDPSYTSTTENVMASQWVASADEMLRDPYFQKDTCLPKIRSHLQDKNIRGANRYDLFMRARRHDLNGEEPSLSSQQSIGYFQSGLFSSIAAFYASRRLTELCSTEIDQRIAELQTLSDAASEATLNAVISPKREQLSQAISRYNDLIQQQIAAGAVADLGEATVTVNETIPDGMDVTNLPPVEPLAPGEEDIFAGLEKPAPGTAVSVGPALPSSGPQLSQEEQAAKTALILRLQQETDELSKEIMGIERSIVEDLDQNVVRPQIPASDPCLRS